MISTAPLLRLLGDEARLRLLRLLDRERLNVGELAEVVGLAQPGVSRHLRLLREAGLVAEERSGGFAFYRTLPGAFATGAARALLEDLREGGGADDLARLKDVLRRRSDRRPGASLRPFVPGRSWAAWARAIGLLLPKLKAVDLGCGDGYLTLEVAAWASSVTGIDQSADMLARARTLAMRRRIANATWKRGALEKLPLKDATFDLAILSQVLHDLPDPARGLAEAHRVLKRGGRVLVAELRPHREEWVKQKWPGFSRAQLRSLLHGAGFQEIQVRPGDSRRGDPFAVDVAAGVKA